MSGQPFSDFLDDCLVRIDPAKPFKPTARYNRDRNQLEVFWDDARCYAEDIGGMKIYRDDKTNEVVGVTVYMEQVK